MLYIYMIFITDKLKTNLQGYDKSIQFTGVLTHLP